MFEYLTAQVIRHSDSFLKFNLNQLGVPQNNYFVQRFIEDSLIFNLPAVQIIFDRSLNCVSNFHQPELVNLIIVVGKPLTVKKLNRNFVAVSE